MPVLNYYSPLHLFPEGPSGNPELSDLKLLRKQLLLRLELAGTTTIEIGGREYSRNDIIQAIDDLQEHFDHHLRLFRNGPLLHFIESGEMTLFQDREYWSDLSDPDFQRWLEPYFTQRYSSILYDGVRGKGHHPVAVLRQLLQPDLPMPATYFDPSRHRTYRYLQETITSGRKNELVSKKIYKLPLQINALAKHIFTPHIREVLRLLETDFATLREDFGRLAARFLRSIFKQVDNLEEIDLKALPTVRTAARISADVHDNPDMEKLAVRIDRYLASATREKTKLEKFFTREIIFLLAVKMVVLSLLNPFRERSAPEHPAEQYHRQELAANLYKELMAAHLPGDWQRSTPGTGTDSIIHYYSFYENKSGKSLYYLPQKDGQGYCSFSIQFNWQLEVSPHHPDGQAQLNLRFYPESTQQDCVAETLDRSEKQLFRELSARKYNSKEVRALFLSPVSKDIEDKHYHFQALSAAAETYRKAGVDAEK